MRSIMKFYLALILFWSLCGCDKSGENTLSSPLNGRAVYTSPLNLTTDTLPLVNHLVRAKDVATGELYELRTDSTGRFYLPGWSKEKQFEVSTNMERSDEDEYRVVYTANMIWGGSDLKDVLVQATPGTAQYRTALLSARDVFGGKVAGAKMLLYTTRAIAALDSTFTGRGVLVSLTTNQYGRCLAMQMPQDSVYIKSEFRFNDSTYLQSNILAIRFEKMYTDTSVVIR